MEQYKRIFFPEETLVNYIVHQRRTCFSMHL
jgi:hypothetical protein